MPRCGNASRVPYLLLPGQVDANRALGLPDDAREYDCVPEILAALDIRSIALMTNNPRKISVLQVGGS